MNLAIMQPYMFPYIGYFQLIQAVDLFVIYDDAQWIQQGWINRNRILMQGKPQYISLPIEKGNLHDKIKQRRFASGFGNAARKILAQIEQNYRKTPHFGVVMPIVQRCFSLKEDHVLPFVINSLKEFCYYMNIATPFLNSSELDITEDLRGQGRVIEINRKLGAGSSIRSSKSQPLSPF